MKADLYNDYLNIWESIKNINSQKDIEELDLKCPSCNGDIILKNGDIREKHFAHKHTSKCKFFNSVKKGQFIPKNYLKQLNTAYLYEDKIWNMFNISVETYLQSIFDCDLDIYNGNFNTINKTQFNR